MNRVANAIDLPMFNEVTFGEKSFCYCGYIEFSGKKEVVKNCVWWIEYRLFLTTNKY